MRASPSPRPKISRDTFAARGTVHPNFPGAICFQRDNESKNFPGKSANCLGPWYDGYVRKDPGLNVGGTVKHLEPGNLIVQKTPVWTWWVVRGGMVMGQQVETRAGQAATVLGVAFAEGAPHEGFVDAMLGEVHVRSYVKLARWRKVWEAA